MIDDVLTRSAYKSICLQQREEVKSVFPVLLNNILPKRIIEVGTGYGGLTLFLRDNLPSTSEVYSFDIVESVYHKDLREHKINIFNGNIFEEKTDWNEFILKQEWEHLFNVTPKIVICDGGHKRGEFNGLAKYLNAGDIIMLHDYSTDRESFEKLNVWNWLECQYSEIKKSCETYNLVPYMHDEFLNVAWGCFQKT